uniref:histidinol-phosphate transaminase n=1 Tax=Auxenochlorella protothecoides TaxID=3075 RepID=A0A1D1ZZ84_AUXPR
MAPEKCPHANAPGGCSHATPGALHDICPTCHASPVQLDRARLGCFHKPAITEKAQTTPESEVVPDLLSGMRCRHFTPCQAAETRLAHPPPARPSVKDARVFIRPHLRNLAPYKPIVPLDVISARLGFAEKDIVKLDANENPYGPPPEVTAALASLEYPNIYPDPESRALCEGLSRWHGIPVEHLMVGAGADELLDFIMRCVLEPGEYIVDCPPTFTMYAYDAAVNAARVCTVPRLDGFRLDIKGIKKAVEEVRPKILFLTSPNNPDGSIVSDEDILELLELPVLVVFDEAYIEFSDEPSKMGWVQQYENLIVLRTFSKCAALAGMRLGYGAFPLSLIEVLWRAKQPYNVTVATQVAGLAAMRNIPYIERVRDLLVVERERLSAALLEQVPYLRPFPSHANFLLCRVTDGRDAAALRERLAREYGVMIRHYSTPDLQDCVRISVGKQEHTDKLIAALVALQ